MDKMARELFLKNRPVYDIPGEYPLGSEYDERETRAVMEAVVNASKGSKGFEAHNDVRIFEEKFASYVGAKYAVAVNSGGVALDMILRSLGLDSGDEVISSAINFVGTHLSIVNARGKLILCEPDPLTLNLNPVDVELRITPKTRAIVVTHMNGLSADMDGLLRVTRQSQQPIAIVSDAARSIGAEYYGRKVGVDGFATMFSFQSKKQITTLGEGGMITTNDEKLAVMMKQYRSFGCEVGWGTSCKMTKPQAAVGSVQIQKLDGMNERRRKVARDRDNWLADIPGIQLPVEPVGYKHVYYLYSILLPKSFKYFERDRLRRVLSSEFGVGAAIGNRPTYLKNQLLANVLQGQEVPIAEDVGSRLICLPIHSAMSEAVNGYITAAFCEVYESIYRQCGG